MAGLAAVRRPQVAADSAAIVATPLLTVQHQALVHGLRLLDMPPCIQQPSCDLASSPVDAASLVGGWEDDDHLRADKLVAWPRLSRVWLQLDSYKYYSRAA